MTPHKQLIRHAPEDGRYGDCYRTVLACLLNLHPSEVPHFYDRLVDQPEPVEVRERIHDWLAARGLARFRAAYNAHGPDDDGTWLMRHLHEYCQGVPLIFLGRSRTGCNHAVIAHGGRIAHDPGLDDPGIVGPCDDGLFHVEVLAAVL